MGDFTGESFVYALWKDGKGAALLYYKPIKIVLTPQFP